MKKINLFLLLCILAAAAQAQMTYVMAWEKHLPSKPSELLADSAGNTYVLYDRNTNPQSFQVTKYNSSGDSVWQTLPIPVAYARHLKFDRQGALLLGGSGAVQGSSRADFYVTKIDTSGQIQWSALVNNQNNDDELVDLCVDAANNIILCGTSFPPGLNHNSMLTAKLDPNGYPLWKMVYSRDTGVYHNPIQVLTDASDNVYVYGDYHHIGSSTDSLLFVKYNSAGLLSKALPFEPSTSGCSRTALKMALLGHTLFFGYSPDCPNPSSGYFVSSMDTSLGQQTFVYSKYVLSDLVADEKNNHLLMFFSKSDFPGVSVPDSSYLVSFKAGILNTLLLTAGNTQGATPYALHCLPLQNGTVAVTYMQQPVDQASLGVTDAAMSKLSWSWATPSITWLNLSPPVTDHANNIWVFENSAMSGFDQSKLQKFSLSPLGIASSNMPSAQVKVYPNPAQDRIFLSAANIKASEAVLEISDLQGRVVLKRVLVLKGEELQEEVNIADLPKGMYMLNLRAGEVGFTQKVVIGN